jgi:hypothetical protein
MATQSQGIQQLLAAEKKAGDIVAEARKSRLIFFLNLSSTFYNVISRKERQKD